MNVTVPTGPNTATLQVLAADGSDVTGSCTITATSSDPTIIQIGNPDASTPNVIPFTALLAGDTADVTYTATNAAGSTTQTDTLTIAEPAPAGMTVTYGSVIPVVNPQKSKK